MTRQGHRGDGGRRRKRRYGARWAGDRAALSLMMLVGAGLFAAIDLDPFGRVWGFLSSPRSFHSTRLTMDQARAVNAAIPFAPGRRVPARPFRFHGTPAAREQAVQCLATAALYEAGDDPRGQRAVMQVVLNRARQPGFPRTICGVVYQGATQATGCQFSFACDGSIQRRPERAGWAAARRAAQAALAGDVFRPVGTATHYHTDWIVPYWAGSLDKIARIHTHIFYAPRPIARSTNALPQDRDL